MRSSILRQARSLSVLIALAAAGAAQTDGEIEAPLSTRSFTSGAAGSDPGTLTVSPTTITVDLRAIRGARVYRATLDPYQAPAQSIARYDLRDARGNTLPLLAPRYLTFDATAAVREAVRSGSLTLQIADPGQGFGSIVSLDVLCNRRAPAPIAQVAGAQARFRDGDTMVTFAEVNPPHTAPTWTVGGFDAAMAANGPDRSPKSRYRIYRSRVPFTDAAALERAELVDEIRPLSGWNGRMHSHDPTWGGKNGLPIVTLPLADGTLSPPGTGIWVRRHPAGQGAETAYYLVSHARDGAEDFSWLQRGANATAAAAVEAPGPGMTVLWKQQHVQGQWYFRSGVDMTLQYFVRWSSPPEWNVPSHPFNYRLGVPHNTAVPNPPLEIAPHAWSGEFDEYRDWQWYDQGALLLTFNLLYYNSYTAFHECAGTLRSYEDGTVQPFVWARLLGFVVDFAKDRFAIDMDRIALNGASMGGAAGHLWGMRSGHLFACIDAAVGNNIPAEDLTSEFENEGEWGQLQWGCRYSNAPVVRFGYPAIKPQDNYPVWDYFDNTQWLARNPRAETPYLSYANAPNDAAIGWPQAWKVTQSMIATRRAFNFSWGQNGHSESSEPPPIAFARNRSIPAFARMSLDDDLGTNPFNGAPQGGLNRHLRWDTSTQRDEAGGWEMDIWLDPAAPQGACTADLTPRRVQRLGRAPGQTYTWQLTESGGTRALGAARADADGLFTLPGLRFSTSTRRVIVTPASGPSLQAAAHHLAAANGTSIDLSLDGGTSRAGRLYVILGNLTGTVPGTPLPGGARLPLNWDRFTDVVAGALNTPLFVGFLGNLGTDGRANARLALGPLPPAAAGLTMAFAWTAPDRWDAVSNPVGIEIHP